MSTIVDFTWMSPAGDVLNGFVYHYLSQSICLTSLASRLEIYICIVLCMNQKCGFIAMHLISNNAVASLTPFTYCIHLFIWWNPLTSNKYVYEHNVCMRTRLIIMFASISELNKLIGLDYLIAFDSTTRHHFKTYVFMCVCVCVCVRACVCVPRTLCHLTYDPNWTLSGCLGGAILNPKCVPAQRMCSCFRFSLPELDSIDIM
jgi:hypothetical protein